MFEIESQCPECGHKNQVECETWKEKIEGTKRDLNIFLKDFTKKDAFMAIQAYDVYCQECSEKYILEDSDNWDEIEKIIKKNV